MALNSLFCADVPLSNYSLTRHSTMTRRLSELHGQIVPDSRSSCTEGCPYGPRCVSLTVSCCKCCQGDGSAESRSRRRWRMGDVVSRVVQSRRLSLALRHRPVRQPEGDAGCILYACLFNINC